MISIMKGSRGLKTQTEPIRSIYSKGESGYAGAVGLTDFSACMNVDISDSNEVSRRRGMVKRVPENAHSLWPIGDGCLFVIEDGLWLLKPGFSGYSKLATVTPGRMTCAVVDSKAYWSNGAQKGKVVAGVNTDWVKGDVVSMNQTRIFYDPPVCRHLGYFNGRMYASNILDEKEILYSEHYGPDVFAKADSFLSLESPVAMIRPVGGGIFISEADKTWFVSGPDPKAFDWKVVDDHPALPWSDKPAVGSMQFDGSYTYVSGGKREVAFWLTNEGVMFGDADGTVYNITEDKIDLVPPYTSGAILIDGSTLIAQFIK